MSVESEKILKASHVNINQLVTIVHLFYKSGLQKAKKKLNKLMGLHQLKNLPDFWSLLC